MHTDLFTNFTNAIAHCESAGGTIIDMNIALAGSHDPFDYRYWQRLADAEGARMDREEWDNTAEAARSVVARIRSGQLSSGCDKILSNITSDRTRVVPSNASLSAVRNVLSAPIQNGFTASDPGIRSSFLNANGQSGRFQLGQTHAGTIFLRPGADRFHADTFSGLILHELLHVVGYSDRELKEGLGIPDTDPENSHPISVALERACFR